MVYCGSSSGNNPSFAIAAKQTAQAIVSNNLGLVYGGGKVGLMGILADEVLRLGGEVIGIIPEQLYKKEVGHTQLTRLEIVENMHQRKARMFELSDACIALPGGIGTFEELFEAFTWSQLGLHHKPCGVLNVNGYFNPLLACIEQMVAQGFLPKQHASQLNAHQSIEQLLQLLFTTSISFDDKWWEEKPQ